MMALFTSMAVWPLKYDFEAGSHVDDELWYLHRSGCFDCLDCHPPHDGHDAVDAEHVQLHGP